MKKHLVFIVLIIFIVTLTGCDAVSIFAKKTAAPTATLIPTVTGSTTPEKTATNTPDITETPEITTTPTETPTNTPMVTPTPTKTPTATPTSTVPQLLPELKAIDSSFYKKGYTTNPIVAVDQFGRILTYSTQDRSNKQVGMFFWLWIGQPQASSIYDATKIAAMPNGNDILFKIYDSKDPLYSKYNKISPNGQAHYWGEPLWGYYNSADEWVIRKQMELITQCDVDFIFFDTTNAITYKNVYMKILKVISEMMKEGFDAPQVAFYTHSRSMDTTRTLYNELYKPGYYKETWYRLNGKPMIIAYTKPADDIAEAKSRGEEWYSPSNYSSEIQNFFTFKKPNWPFDPTYADGFPWIEWSYPQPMHTDGRVMSVSVASHPGVPMSFSLTRLGHINWGRGWNVITKKNVSADVNKGTFFQSEWDAALKADPDMISVGGWNEWIAYKQPYQGEYMLCDAASLEYSRDIEMMKGGYNDAFMIQLMRNVRKYKTTRAVTTTNNKATINIKADGSAWADISAIYRSVNVKNIKRYYAGGAIGTKYTQDPARNNIEEVRVAQDASSIYFYIRAEKAITDYHNQKNWMNIFIGRGEPSQKGWESYEYLINRDPKDGGKTSIHKLGSNFSLTAGGTAEYSLRANVLQVKIPRSALGLSASDNKFYFKVSDGVTKQTDIMDYYVTGKSLPMGRLSFQFLG